MTRVRGIIHTDNMVDLREVGSISLTYVSYLLMYDVWTYEKDYP